MDVIKKLLMCLRSIIPPCMRPKTNKKGEVLKDQDTSGIVLSTSSGIVLSTKTQMDDDDFVYVD